MNKSNYKVFLLGNGFDLAHGLETKYSHFIKSLESIDYSDEDKFSRAFIKHPYSNQQSHKKILKSSVLRKVNEESDDSHWADIELTYFLLLKERLKNAKKTKGKPLLLIQKFNNEFEDVKFLLEEYLLDCLLYTSPSPRDRTRSRMPSSA